MAINTQIQDNTARITLSGRFDFKVHSDFKDTYTTLLADDAVQDIEIEMSKLTYMDSSMLGMLMLLHESAKAVNKTVSLLNPTGVVSELLEASNIDRLFSIRQTA